MEKRDAVPHEPHDLARAALTSTTRGPAAAARWLADAFGFEAPSGLPEGEDPLSDEKYGFPWIEFHVGNASLVIDQLEGPPVDHAQVTHEPWVFVDDLEAHLTRARGHGATIVQDIQSHGFTSYVALDLEGRRWRLPRPARRSRPRLFQRSAASASAFVRWTVPSGCSGGE